MIGFSFFYIFQFFLYPLMKSVLTSSSAVAFRYSNGIILSADTSLNYGSLKKERDIEKHLLLPNNTVLLMNGEYSDFQEIKSICEREMTRDEDMGVREWIMFLQRTMYLKRSRTDPLNISIIVAGYDDYYDFPESQTKSLQESGTRFLLGVVDNVGNFCTDEVLTCGISTYLALPHLRDHNVTSLDREAATKLMKESMQTLYYRSCMADNHVKILGIEADKVWINDPVILNGSWDHGKDIQ